MVMLGARAQKLPGKKITVGKINYENEQLTTLGPPMLGAASVELELGLWSGRVGSIRVQILDGKQHRVYYEPKFAALDF